MAASIVFILLVPTAVRAQSPPMLWSQQLTSDVFDIDGSGSIALDREDSLYLAGNFNDPVITIGNQTLTNRGTMATRANGFIAKFSKTGDFLWVQQIGGNYEDVPITCATDNQEDVFVTGYFSSSNIVLGGVTLTNSQQQGTETCFLAKYDPQGNVLWARQSFTTVLPSQGASWDFGTSVAVDADGNAWLAGTFTSSNIFFGTNLLVNPNYASIQPGVSQDFLVKYSSTGDVLWATEITVSTDNSYPTISLGTNGDGVFCANFPASAIVGTNTVTNQFGGQSLLLAKFDSSGNVLWATFAAHGVAPFGGPVVVDLQGNAWISGSAPEAFGTNASPPPGSGSDAGFVAKFDLSGNFLMAVIITNESYPRILVDAIGNGYAVDRYGATKYAVDGSALWSTIVFGQTGGFALGAVDPAGSLFVVGKDSPWDGYVATELSGPYLNIQPAGNQVVVSWPTNEVGLGLESALDLSGLWSPVTNPAPAVLGNNYVVTNDASTGNRFYRLGSH